MLFYFILFYFFVWGGVGVRGCLATYLLVQKCLVVMIRSENRESLSTSVQKCQKNDLELWVVVDAELNMLNGQQ